MTPAAKIIRYELSNLVRSPFVVAMTAVLLVVTEVLFRFDGDIAKTITSLMNVVLVIVPLISIVLGTFHFYNSREFNELLLAQPLNRTTIYLGKLLGFTVALWLAFLAGLGLPFAIRAQMLAGYLGKLVTLLAVGIGFIALFSSLAFYVATRFEDRLKGLGFALLAWFCLAVVWDGALLLFVHIFHEYNYEPAMMALVFLNPIDLGRILILLQLDISALMGYSGALFRKTFGSDAGLALSAVAMALYALIPILIGLRTFKRRDF